MNAEIRRIVEDPAWFVHRYDPPRDCFQFLRVDRAERERATFLTDQYLPDAGAPVAIARGDVIAAMDGCAAAPVHFIFHSAFCCSTLLAKAFDRPGMATVLKEPVVLNDLVGWRQRGAPPGVWSQVQRDAMVALARPFGKGEAVVVKPSNITTSMTSSMLDVTPTAKAILMYAPLETFLTSVAKKGLDGRLWVRTLLTGFLRDGIADLGFDATALFGQSDLQIAALGWLVQHSMFQRLLTGPHAMRCRSLSSDDLLHSPERTFGDAALFFEVAGASDLTERHGEMTVFHHHSKTGTRFATTDRSLEYEQAMDRYGDEIGKVAVWAKHVADHNAIGFELAHKL